MKKYFCRASVVTGFVAGSLLVHAQSAGGAGAGGGAAAGGAGSASGAAAGAAGPAAAGRAAAGGTAAGISAGANANAPGVGQPGANVGVNARGGTINSIGAAGINQPAAVPPVGGATVIGNSPNTIGGSSITAQNPGAPAGAGTVGTLPSAGVIPSGAPANRAAAGAGVDSTQLGALGGVQAGIPLTTLPAPLQQTIQSRLGGAAVQTISRDDLANGTVYRVTSLQNGVPTESRFAANGTFLGNTALPGTATSFVTPGVVAPGVVLDTLPAAVQSTIRSQAGAGRINSVTPQGQGWVVTYDASGRPMTMLVGPDGRVIRVAPTAVGAPAPAATGAGTSTNNPAGAATNGQRTSSLNLDDLPEDVRASLAREIGAADVRYIRREQRPAGDVYVVSGRTDDNYVQLTLDGSGKIVRDSRDVPVVAVGAAAHANSEIATGIPIQRVPVAVQNAVKAYASRSDIRSVNLGLDQGKAVYDVVFMRGGQRDRMIVAKDGTLVRMERNVSQALDAGVNGPRLAVGDLPAEVRETIQKQTDHVLIKDVGTKKLGDQVVYSVTYETNGAPVELLVASDGVMIVPQTAPDAEKAGSPSPAPLPARNDPTPVRVVDNIAASVAPDSGRAASIETSTNASDRAADQEPKQKVALTDVPLAVQTSAMKLAGSGVIEAINPTLGDAGVVYEVTVSENGNRRKIRLNKDGAVRTESKD